MEFLGKTVKKEFAGNGVCSGVVKSYNESSGLFEIGYEDGNSEELGFSELNCLLEGMGVEPAQVKRRPGRKPKKHRRAQLTKVEDGDAGGESGNSNSNFCNQIIAETLGGDIRDCNGNIDLNDGLSRDLREGERASGNTEIVSVDLNVDVEKASGVEENVEGAVYANGSLNGNGALDLNCGFNFNLNDGFDLNEENADDRGSLKKRQCIDLNLDVNGRGDDTSPELGMDNSHIEGERTKCSFDLNLGVDEEVIAGQSTSDEMVTQTTEKRDISGALERFHSDFDIANGTLQEVPVINDLCLEFAKGIWKKDIVTGQDFSSFGSVEVQDVTLVMEDSPEVIDGNQVHLRSAFKEGSSGRRRGRRRLNDVDNLNTPETTPLTGTNDICGTHNNVSAYREVSVLRRGRSRGNHVNALNSTPDTTIIENSHAAQVVCTTQSDVNQVDEGSGYKEVMGNHRKRRRLSGSVNVAQETTVLRRSSRRGSVKTDSSTITTISAVNGSLNELSVSPSVSGLTKEKTLKSCRKRPDEPVILPAKVQLPASSQKMDLSGISVVDLFSVYSCLRSFSTILYLSPFELEDFVAALRCAFPSSLIDCIHVSILRTLRKHLEFLSNEGVESASVCLRSLNWGFLDLVTWPIFMVEYLLIQDLELKPGYSLSNLELLKNDYYKQPVSVKVEILRCLCDGITEIEAIRSELNKRSSGAEFDMDFERNMNPVSSRNARNVMDLSGGSNLMEETLEDTADGNIDECCLCKMDGSLICCDGCPAAYHSKCVGVVSDSLPEGDWFCPECAIDRNRPWMKFRSSIRGAEPLGVDPYGRLYFGSCGYLLVSDSSENESSFSYYHRDELNAVIRVLRSSQMVYGSILDAIHKHWDIPVSLYGETGNVDISNHSMSLEVCMLPAFSEMCTMNSEIADGRKPVEKSVAGGTSNVNIEASKSVNETCVSSEGSAETTQTSLTFQNFPKEESTFPNKSTELLHESDMLGKFPPMGDKSSDLRSKNSLGTNDGTSRVHMGTGYMNYYSFGHIASLIAEELLQKPSDKSTDTNTVKTEEEMISTQMKIMSKICPRFHWPNTTIQSFDVQKEKCGWCFTCRGASDDLSCLFNMSFSFVHEGPENDVIGLHSKRNKEGHLADIISHILGVEKRLLGLLSGPWLNPHYSSLWRKSVLAASDIESVKHLLLTLVSNVRHLALSAEWLKHVDSSITLGSASHIIMASSRASSKKRARQSEFDSGPSSSVSGLAMLWWRGGRISRRLFNWKVLPRCLVTKAARQAGCVKIPGMLYHENSDFAKRSKYIAWQAAVESSTTAEQLALQVREFDSNIRWDEIEKATSLSLVDKEFKKSVRLFKKVVVRRKSVEGDGTKYLLDFGKRRSIPEIVLKNGSVVEESSSERKKYWLNESNVPLYILKSFEEKRFARKSGKPTSGKLSDASLAMKKPSKKRGFSYLFDKAERPQYHQCGHCNKDVPIRDAVCCQYCKGFFHKRHVRKSAGAVAAQCTYTCHKCAGAKTGKTTKIVTKAAEIRKAAKIVAKSVQTKGKRGRKPNKIKIPQLENSKKASVRAVQLTNIKRTLRSTRLPKNNKVTVVVPLRRSPRKVKYISSQSKKVGRSKKTKKTKPKKTTYKKRQPKVISWQKKRTHAYHSYWLNGLLLSRKPDDVRIKQFRRKRFLAPSESIIRDQPRCHLCSEAGYRSTSTYISCEICGEWFHGDAYGLGEDNMNMLIGFRCHLCRKCTPPRCPFVSETQATIEPTNDTPFVSESNLLQDSSVNEVHQDPLTVVDKEQLDTAVEFDQDVIATSNVDLDAVMTEVGPSDCDSARDDGKSTEGKKSVDW